MDPEKIPKGLTPSQVKLWQKVCKAREIRVTIVSAHSDLEFRVVKTSIFEMVPALTDFECEEHFKDSTDWCGKYALVLK